MNDTDISRQYSRKLVFWNMRAFKFLKSKGDFANNSLLFKNKVNCFLVLLYGGVWLWLANVCEPYTSLSVFRMHRYGFKFVRINVVISIIGSLSNLLLSHLVFSCLFYFRCIYNLMQKLVTRVCIIFVELVIANNTCAIRHFLSNCS